MTLYINKYVALIKAFRKYIHNNNKILFALFCKVYKHILNTKRKEIKKMFNRKHKWILRGRGYQDNNRFMYDVLFVTTLPLWNLCMQHGTIKNGCMIKKLNRFTGNQKTITITGIKLALYYTAQAYKRLVLL